MSGYFLHWCEIRFTQELGLSTLSTPFTAETLLSLHTVLPLLLKIPWLKVGAFPSGSPFFPIERVNCFYYCDLFLSRNTLFLLEISITTQSILWLCGNFRMIICFYFCEKCLWNVGMLHWPEPMPAPVTQMLASPVDSIDVLMILIPPICKRKLSFP